MLDPDQRRIFAALADVLIPASDTMPSAVSAGVADALIDQVLGYRPDLAEPLAAAVAACAGKDPVAALDELAAQSPEQFEALTVLTAGAYFQSPAVKAAMPYDARAPTGPRGHGQLHRPARQRRRARLRHPLTRQACVDGGRRTCRDRCPRARRTKPSCAASAGTSRRTEGRRRHLLLGSGERADTYQKGAPRCGVPLVFLWVSGGRCGARCCQPAERSPWAGCR